MNAEELEIARRLVACKGWVWLPGMQISGGDRPMRIFGLGHACAVVMGHSHCAMVMSTADVLPDLSDDLTRLGVLAVVRRAWDMPLLCAYPVKMADSAPWWNVGVPWSRENCGVFCETGSTELAALLAALEAAP